MDGATRTGTVAFRPATLSLTLHGRVWHSCPSRLRLHADSNSSGGAGLVTGRITGLAADNAGDVYAGSANGGVRRSSTTGGGTWQPISDKIRPRLRQIVTDDLQPGAGQQP